MDRFAKVFSAWNQGEIHGLSWLEEKGMTPNQAYRAWKEGHLRKIGSGVYARPFDELSWVGAVSAMQNEFGLPFHVGGLSALSLSESDQNIPLGKRPLILLVNYQNRNLPSWVEANDWSADFRVNRSRLFSGDLGLEILSVSGVNLIVASRELAILEVIDQAEFSDSFESLENLLEGLRTMRPQLLQKLLEDCRSVKTKRIFLYLSEKLGTPYFERLKPGRIDLGSGPREVIKGGVMSEKYQITVPQEVE